ncbi:4Fe-4S binding protein [Clostridium grantii]|uniref:Ferredoxin n=1 Tax=Clostridium grantii DSM 8605 TaxID=1121316 RepID=A0A1M5XNQ6_9CLOT|nr:4Fe-4S binding protein [Clostridium grantii]SHI00863.1 Uncharacterized protein, pyridoxamine 5'-phosphate oxidase (PNPOx-like) family [Clostridium grantii DSM 8605]
MKKAFEMLKEIKSVVISTSENGTPHSRIIDIMSNDHGLYFITLKVKPFYNQLKNNNKIAITAMNKDYAQVRIQGEITELSASEIEKVFENKKSLQELFPDKNSYNITSLFHVSKGKGEIFDLSGKEVKMKRERFAFGGETVNEAGLIITDKCIACGKCKPLCPFNAIEAGDKYSIIPKFCDECGTCYNVCPVNAIELSKGM